MKRMILIAVAALTITTGVMVSSSEAQMGRRNRGYYQQQNPGFFARLMELERRKNEWLFGR
jgi:hypothetical protein